MAEFEKLDSSWSESEFQGLSFGDKRVEKRLLKVAEQLSSNLQLTIYAATKEWACAKVHIDYLITTKLPLIAFSNRIERKPLLG